MLIMSVQKFISNDFNITSNLEIGKIVEGTVKNIQPYGAFIEFEGNKVRIIAYRRYISSKNKVTI